MKPSSLEYISTSTLRAMSIALSRRPWSRLLRGFRCRLEEELLARDLPSIAEESGGWLVAGVQGVQ